MSDHIIPGAVTVAVSSGKGGVGKSTTAASLAVALADRGADVIVIDADIDGPNIHLIGEVPDLELGVNPEELRLQLPVSSYGFRLISPVSIRKVDPAARVHVSDLVGIAQFADPADIVVVDLPPAWTEHHAAICSVLPELVVTMVAPTQPAISDHERHLDSWNQQWSQTVRGRRDRDKRRKLVLPEEPTFVVAESMARFTGIPETGGDPVTVRRLDAVPADEMARLVNPVMSIPAAGTLVETANTAELQRLADMVTSLAGTREGAAS